MDEWSYSFINLDLGTRGRRIVSFTPLPLCPEVKAPWIPVV
jgi:hypothetical protein